MLMRPIQSRPARHIIYPISLAVIAGLIVVGCRGGQKDEATPPASATPWPTLAQVVTLDAVTLTAPVESSGPQLVDQFRVDVQSDAVSIFPLAGDIDQPVRIEVIVLSGTLDPAIVISNLTGHQLAQANSGGLGQPEVIGQFIFPGNGYYELGISSVSGSGEVGVSIYRLSAADLEGGGVFSSIDQELSGSMTNPASYHTFRLPLERGTRVDITATALSEGLDLLFELYGPDGTLLAARDDNVGVDPVLWNFMPDQSGTYTLVLSNFDEHVGDYNLRISPSESGAQAVLGRRTTLTLQGSPRRSTWLTLDGRALDGIEVEARPLSPGVDIQVTLTDPNGNVLVTANLSKADEPERITLAMFPYDGEYQIEFLTLGESGEIDYYIGAVRGADIEMGGRVSLGRARHEGAITGPGTALVYAFEAAAGDLVGIDAHATGDSELDLGFTLFDPDGYLVMAADDLVGKDPIVDRIELTVAGRYVLIIWNFGDTTGTFDLYLTNPEAPDAPPDE